MDYWSPPRSASCFSPNFPSNSVMKRRMRCSCSCVTLAGSLELDEDGWDVGNAGLAPWFQAAACCWRLAKSAGFWLLSALATRWPAATPGRIPRPLPRPRLDPRLVALPRGVAGCCVGTDDDAMTDFSLFFGGPATGVEEETGVAEMRKSSPYMPSRILNIVGGSCADWICAPPRLVFLVFFGLLTTIGGRLCSSSTNPGERAPRRTGRKTGSGCCCCCC